MMNSFSTSENNTQNSTSKLKTSPLCGESQRDKQWCDHCHKPYTCWKIHGKPTYWKGKNPKKVTQTAYAVEYEEGKTTNVTLTMDHSKLLQWVLN